MNRAKFYTSVVLTVLLLFGLTAPAHAITTLVSSPLFVGLGQIMWCAITNAGPHPITVTIQMLDVNGDVVDSLESFILGPGALTALANGIPGARYCKFTGNFNRGYVRANAQIQDNNTTLAVVPAQGVGE